MKSDIKSIINLVQNKYFQNLILDIDEENTDLCMIIQSIEPEYRMVFFNDTYKFLDREDYCIGLKESYIRTEGINTINAKLPLKETLNLFKIADPKILMKEDYNKFLELPEEVEIYRGTTNKEYIPAMSWTIDKKRAIWFYQKYEKVGTVFRAKIKKEDIICYLDETSCGEKEVIVDYEKIYDVEELKEDEINQKITINNEEQFVANTDYVVAATQYLLNSLAQFGILPRKELAEEIYKTYQYMGKYKSKYILQFPPNQSIELGDFIDQFEKDFNN